MQYVKPERVWIKNDSALNENWVQARIAEDPSLLGFGDLILVGKEIIQPRAGRLDLLCQDGDSSRRYEIEIQLGATDPSHIVRTIEYWDIERKRYPQYEHTAVIVAEEITGRFLNVISLFNGFIPLVAIQMQAIRIGDQVALIFTRVLDQLRLGQEVEPDAEITNRAYWEKRASKQSLELTDALFELLKKLDPYVTPKYNKYYIGCANKDGQANNYVAFRPKKDCVQFEPRLEKSDLIQAKLDDAQIEMKDYDEHWGRYRIRVTNIDMPKHEALFSELMKTALDVS